MDVKGVVGHVVSGTKILLECKVSAARPPANVTWYNGTDFLTNDNDRFEMFETKIDDNVSTWIYIIIFFTIIHYVEKYQVLLTVSINLILLFVMSHDVPQLNYTNGLYSSIAPDN